MGNHIAFRLAGECDDAVYVAQMFLALDELVIAVQSACHALDRDVVRYFSHIMRYLGSAKHG